MKKLILIFAISITLVGCETTQQTQQVNTSTTTAPVEDSMTNSTSTGYYQVVSVVDGDTVKVNIDGKTETLRLIGIDTPETVDPRKVVQCFGKEASNKAKEWLTGKTVELEADLASGERDKYNRLLRYVKVKDGMFYNLEIVKQGYAHEYTYNNIAYKYQDDFKNAEKYAQENKLGLWADNTCSGDTTKAAATSTPTLNNNPQVKKSTTGICHEVGSTYYIKTTNYIPYNSIAECLASGGRLPLR